MKTRRIIDAFRGHRAPMLAEVQSKIVSKLPESLQQQASSVKNLSGLISFLTQKVKDLSEAKAREPQEDEFSETYFCTFCRVVSCHICDIITFLLLLPFVTNDGICFWNRMATTTTSAL